MRNYKNPMKDSALVSFFVKDPSQTLLVSAII